MNRLTKKETPKRESLVSAAADLVRTAGLRGSSLAKIAARAGIPVGNFYYYFKTKKALGEAVVGLQDRMVRQRLAAYEAVSPDPRRRIAAFIKENVRNAGDISRNGCAVAMTCVEFSKAFPASGEAGKLMETNIRWLTKEFSRLVSPPRARGLARQIISAVSGANLLAYILGDASYVAEEERRLVRLVGGL